ncbi:hypothetical protein [uncultured Ruegeria sp.]|uniref:hypothetical protein n=1 Tax=uncultured Ruegeria sp. TaxID=259304 RepID=UPI002639E77C|nr:hypothetical protein [uncultured Ruegeria sp.]
MNKHARHRLPHPRRSVTEAIEHEGHQVQLTFGFYEHGWITEIFGGSTKRGAQIDHLVADVAVALSLGLQVGLTLQQPTKSIGHIPDPFQPVGHRPASLIGAILQTAFQIEGELWL